MRPFFCLLSIGLAVSACRKEPEVCNVVQMTETEFAAYETLPEDQQTNCATQVIPDRLGPQVMFEVVPAS